MSGYPNDPYYNPMMMPPGNVYPPPGQQPQFYPPTQNQGPYQAQTNQHQPFPQYGAPVGQLPPNQAYYNPQQQQQNQQKGCCDTISALMAGLCAGMLCYMCLCDEGGGGCCNEGLMDNNAGESLMGFTE